MKEFKIADAINKDYNNIITSGQMMNFKSRLDYKSAKTREADEQFVNMLLTRLKMYKDGWIKANAMNTVNLSGSAREVENIYELITMFNNTLNSLIKTIRHHIPEDILSDLRELEAQIKKMK